MYPGLRGKFNQCCHDTVQFKIICSRLKDKKLVPVIAECLDDLFQAEAITLDRVSGKCMPEVF